MLYFTDHSFLGTVVIAMEKNDEDVMLRSVGKPELVEQENVFAVILAGGGGPARGGTVPVALYSLTPPAQTLDTADLCRQGVLAARA